MIEKIKNYKHIVPLSYGLFFVLAFIVFLTITFPGDLVRQRIISEVIEWISSPQMFHHF